MIVEAAFSERTPSLSRSAMSPVLALSIADQPLLKLSRGKGPYLCHRILKIKNAIWEIKRDKVWKSKISWKIKMKHALKQKSAFLFNQRQNINKTRVKISEFYKWYSSNTVDIKYGKKIFSHGSNLTLFFYSFFFFFLPHSIRALSATDLLIHWW